MTSKALIDLGVLDEQHTLSDARTQVARLAQRYRLTDSEIAKATDASPRTVTRWREQTGPQRASRYDQRIEQLIEIAEALEEVLADPNSVRTYLIRPNKYLGSAVPINLLGAGLYTTVRKAIADRRGEEPPGKRTRQPSSARRAKRRRVEALEDLATHH